MLLCQRHVRRRRSHHLRQPGWLVARGGYDVRDHLLSAAWGLLQPERDVCHIDARQLRGPERHVSRRHELYRRFLPAAAASLLLREWFLLGPRGEHVRRAGRLTQGAGDDLRDELLPADSTE